MENMVIDDRLLFFGSLFINHSATQLPTSSSLIRLWGKVIYTLTSQHVLFPLMFQIHADLLLFSL